MTDPLEMETTYAYDQMDRKTEEIRDAATGGEQIKTTWVYDVVVSEEYRDKVRAWEDESNYQETTYRYGDEHWPEKVSRTTYPDNGSVSVEYYDDGTVKKRTDQRGWYVMYTYDDAQRVTQEDVTGYQMPGTDTVTYAYDALGRPTSATDNNDPNDSTDNSTLEWTYTRQANGDLEVKEDPGAHRTDQQPGDIHL